MEEVVARAQQCGAGMNPEVRPLGGSNEFMHWLHACCRDQLKFKQMVETPPSLLLSLREDSLAELHLIL